MKDKDLNCAVGGHDGQIYLEDPEFAMEVIQKQSDIDMGFSIGQTVINTATDIGQSLLSLKMMKAKLGK